MNIQTNPSSNKFIIFGEVIIYFPEKDEEEWEVPTVGI